jgi:hypothetical protein
MFRDIKSWRKNPKPNISPSDVLAAFCALPSSNIPEHDPSAPAPEAGPREKATDKFTYRDMSEHTNPPIIYIDEMEDRYGAPPQLYDDFKVVQASH